MKLKMSDLKSIKICLNITFLKSPLWFVIVFGLLNSIAVVVIYYRLFNDNFVKQALKFQAN